MFKKMILVVVFGLFVIQNALALTQSEETQGKDFDHGSNYEECLNNCHDHHHNVLNWRRGKGKGMCWNICRKAHPSKDLTE